MLSTNLTILQHLFRMIDKAQVNLEAVNSHRIRQLADLIEQSEERSSDRDLLIDDLRTKWSRLSQPERDELEELQFELRAALDQAQSWQGLTMRIMLLPESIRRRKNLYRSLVQRYAIAERALCEIIAEESFRVGWEEVMSGKTIPLSQLWEDSDVG